MFRRGQDALMVKSIGIAGRRLPPYLSYRTFRNFLQSLTVSGVPTRIDRSMMASKSGATQVLLLSTIRYLGLASENGIPTAELEKVVHSEGKERQEVWRRILEKSYPNLFNSKLNLERTTTKELEEVFKTQGVTSPETVRKCVTFFSLAARDAGIRLSPHVKPYAGRRQAGRRARATGDEQKETVAVAAPFVATDNDGSTDWQLLLSKFPDFDPSWPEELRKNWFDGFERLSRICKGMRTDTTNGQS
jgi:hypothetical protein